MNYCMKLIDRIVQLLSGGDANNREAVEPLALQYVEMVNRANKRFQLCVAAIHAGNRSEAIRECEESPNLIDLFALLNFQQRDIWEATISYHGFPPPDRLSEKVAQELNEAYSQENGVYGLLKTHRLMALARRPAVERLPVLQALTKLEPTQHHWDTDLRELEKVRLAEIEEDISQAFEKQDARRLLALERELSDTPWLEMPPTSLKQKAVHCSTLVRLETTKREMGQIEQRLNAAYAAQDLTLARQFREQWQAKLRIVPLSGDDPLLRQVADALAWIDEEEAKEQEDRNYHQAMLALIESLDDEAPRTEIERCHAALMQFDRDIPETLARRVHERLRYLEQAATRRMVLILALGIFLVAVSGSVIWFAFSLTRFNNQVQDHVARLDDLIEQKKLEEAGSYFDALKKDSPKVFIAPEVQDAYTRWSNASDEETSRADRFMVVIVNVEKQIEKGEWNDLAHAEQLLDEARNLARLGEENRAIAVLEEKIADRQQAVQDRVDTQYQKQFEPWKEKVAQVDKKNLAALQALESEGWDLLRLAQKEVPPVTKSRQTETSNLTRKVGAWRSTALHVKKTNELLEEMDRAVGTPDYFARLVEQYHQRVLPGQGTGKVDADMKAYAELQKINAALDAIAAESLSRISPERAQQVLEKCKACKSILEKFSGHPLQQMLSQYMQPALPRYVTVLETIVARKKNGAWITNDLNTILDKPIITRLMSVLVGGPNSEMKQYYFATPPFEESDARRWQFKTLTDFDMNNKDTNKIKKVPYKWIRNPKKKDSEAFDWTSPQHRVANHLISRINKIKQGGDWEREFADVLEEINAEPDLEPLLKIQLLQIAIDLASRGSDFLNTALKDERKLLENLPIDFNANWIDPNDEEGKRARESALIRLKQIRPLKPIFDGVIQKRDALQANVVRRLQWAGYLWKENADSKEWKCRRNEKTPLPAGDLYVLVPPVTGNAKSGKFLVNKVGQAVRQGNGTDIIWTDTSDFLTGRPVYLQPTEIPAETKDHHHGE